MYEPFTNNVFSLPVCKAASFNSERNLICSLKQWGTLHELCIYNCKKTVLVVHFLIELPGPVTHNVWLAFPKNGGLLKM